MPQHAFEPVFPKGNEIHVVPFRTALSVLSTMTAPRVVLVDLSGKTQPINALLDLPAGKRLHVLAGAESLDGMAEYIEGGAAMLCQAPAQRYNFLIADARARQSAFARDLQILAQERVIIVDPTMLAVQSFEKFLALAQNSAQFSKPIVVLNFGGRVAGCAGQVWSKGWDCALMR